MTLSLALVFAAALAVVISGHHVGRTVTARALFFLLVFMFGVLSYQLGWQCGADAVICMIRGDNQSQEQPQSGSKPIKSEVNKWLIYQVGEEQLMR